ncbi:MAG: hypothetical protein IJH20_02375 [Bacilli bacterium]|nr:hypothetical protein [Bacilli bacterium]
MKKKIITLLLIITIVLTGCGSKDEPEIKVESLTDKKTRVSIIFNDQKIPKSTKLDVTQVATDYSNLNDIIEKYVAYDIKLVGDSDVELKENVIVSLEIPVDFNRRNLVVYSIDNNSIKDTYDVEISKDKVRFETNKFGIYVLAQVTPDDSKKIDSPRVNSIDEKE